MIPASECEHIDRWDGICPDCGDVDEPDGAGTLCECGSALHDRCRPAPRSGQNSKP